MAELNFHAIFQKINAAIRCEALLKSVVLESVMGELSFNYYFYEKIEIPILLRVSLREQTFRPQKLIKFEMNFNQAKLA